MTEKEIHIICRNYRISNYTINKDMSIDVDGNVLISSCELKKLPLKFNVINGNFNCSYNQLTSLKGCPKKVEGTFNCSYNKLTSLKYSPIKINNYIDCAFNELNTLEGFPNFIKNIIFIDNNNIKSFKGVPEDYDIPILCGENPIYKIYKLFSFNIKSIYWLNEYDVIQNDNIIIERFEEVFHQLNMEIPNIKEIKGYNLI